MICAALVAVGLHVATWHSYGHFNNVNPGVYAECSNGLTVGTYENSVFKQSVYVGKTWTDATDHFELTAGAITGYGGVKPLLVPSIKFHVTEHSAFRLSLLKPPWGPTAVHFSLEWKL